MTKSEQFLETWKIVKGSLTREEFLNSFKTVLDFVKKAVQDLTQKYVEISTKLSNLEEKVNNKLSSVKNGQDGKDGQKGDDGRDGKDSDPQEVARLSSQLAITAVLPKIPTIEQVGEKIPIWGEKIRDSLELLQDSDRLEISAIKDLQEKLDELRELKTRTIGGGGFNYGAMDIHIVDDETPTNSGDNLNFTIAHIPSPTSSLKVYRNGQRLRITEDYTFSGVTITLLTAFSAGEILLVDYRI